MENTWQYRKAFGIPDGEQTLMARRGDAGAAIPVALIGVAFLVAYWQIILAILLIIAIVKLIPILLQSQQISQLRTLTRNADRRFSGEVCRCNSRYALLEAIVTLYPPAPARIEIRLMSIGDEKGSLVLNQKSIPLIPPANLASLSSNLAFKAFLDQKGIVMVNELAVEAKATKAAISCHKEVKWAQGSLKTLQDMVRSARRTLVMAQGNELLEPSIPQLEKALSTFEKEEDRLSDYLKESRSMLRKLQDFLSVPEAIRPILNFDTDQMFDPSRLKDLKTSFQEVVTLNTVFQDLSRDKLA
jgi:hypothetical protein